MKLYVGNLPWKVRTAELRDLFSSYGELTDCVVLEDRETGRSRGFGFVELEDDGARRAIEEMNGREMEGRALRVNEAQPRESRPGGRY